jgi:Cu-processing system permease protein
MRNLWFYEWKSMTRGRSYYMYLLLWIVIFSLLFLLEKSNDGISAFTNTTGTIVNIILYILPLFMMLNGSFSITNEIENGQWNLICTYPVSILSYLLGKFLGLFTAQAVLFTLSFGLSMGIGLLLGAALSVKWLLSIYLFSILLIFIFLISGIFLGTFAMTRWKALAVSVTVWFFIIMIWPTALIAFLGLVPYPFIGLIMKTAMVINPAEFLRVFLIIQWDSGAIFGQSYDSIVQLFQSRTSWLILAGYLILYSSLLSTLSFLKLRRRQLQ